MTDPTPDLTARIEAYTAWFRSRLGDGVSDNEILEAFDRKFPSATRSVARRALREAYKQFAEVHSENFSEQRIKFIEIGYGLLQEARKNGAYGPAAALYRTLATITGALVEGGGTAATSSVAEGAADTVRSRIAKLTADPKVRARATKLGLDLDAPDPGSTAP